MLQLPLHDSTYGCTYILKNIWFWSHFTAAEEQRGFRSTLAQYVLWHDSWRVHMHTGNFSKSTALKLCPESFPWHWFFKLLFRSCWKSKVLYSVFYDMLCWYISVHKEQNTALPLIQFIHAVCFGEWNTWIDSVVYFYHVIILVSIFRDILSLIMFLSPRNYCVNGKISGRNKNLFYEAVIPFSF